MTDSTSSAHKAVKDFLAEAEEIADQLGSELADLSDMSESGDLDPDLLNSIFRGAHSLKGLAGMFGFLEISELSHNMENLLDWLRLGKLNLDQGVMSVLFESHELLTALVRSISEGSAVSHAAEIAACVSRINACLSPPDQTRDTNPFAGLGLSEQTLAALTEYEEHRLLESVTKGKNIFSIHTSFDLTTFDVDLSKITEELKGLGEVISTLPSMDGTIETNIDFDLIFSSIKGLQELSHITGDGVSIKQLSSAVSANTSPTAPATSSSNVSPVSAPAQESSLPVVPQPSQAAAVSVVDDGQSAKSMSRTVRVDIGKLDDLMNIVGELVLAHSSIAALVAKMRNDGFSRMAIDLAKSAKGLERKLTDLQKGVMEIRMIPVGQLYEKMSRIIRKISREQGKKVDLKFYGADTELDKLIVEDISDPMMHIIRNAIDHGIESPERRLALGKSEKGTIRISSFSKGNHVVIEVEDDGSGIDVEKVKAKALQKGLVNDVSSVTDKEAIDFIFLPGFSTTEKVSEVSGRGVGMDVVRNNITAISGMVDIETTKGFGSRFVITLPITLAIIKVLVISCADRTYALPITSVLETLLITEKEVMTVERKQVFQLRDMTLPLLRLDQFFGLEGRQSQQGEIYVVVVGVAEKRLGIAVDNLQGQQDIVIKSLGDSFKKFRGISGAADLGDQRTILVLDVGGMISETMKSGN